MTIQTHDADKCAGNPCVIHNPSDHHMKDWPKHFRPTKNLTERICPHGIGHPDPDDVAYHHSVNEDWVGIHGCDGCCSTNPARRRP